MTSSNFLYSESFFYSYLPSVVTFASEERKKEGKIILVQKRIKKRKNGRGGIRATIEWSAVTLPLENTKLNLNSPLPSGLHKMLPYCLLHNEHRG